MKNKKRILTLMIALSLFLSFGVTAYAEGAEPRWRHISFTTCVLSFDGTKAQCYASVSGNTDVTKITYDAQLEEKGTDGKWKSKISWQDRVVYSSDLTFVEYYNYAKKGKDYRFTLVATVYVGSDGETVTLQKSATNY